ncbi:MAG: SAF domain-containing protein, partial [Dehalococcoidia bacterium]
MTADRAGAFADWRGWTRVDLRLLLGLVLVLASFAAGLLLWSGARTTTPILVAARPIAAGDVVTAEDLATSDAHLEGALAAVALPGGRGTEVIGQTALAPIGAGEMVTRDALGSGPQVGPDDVALTVPVDEGTVFPGLARGARVTVYGTSFPGQVASVTQLLVEQATVFDVDAGRTGIGLGGA